MVKYGKNLFHLIIRMFYVHTFFTPFCYICNVIFEKDKPHYEKKNNEMKLYDYKLFDFISFDDNRS